MIGILHVYILVFNTILRLFSFLVGLRAGLGQAVDICLIISNLFFI